MRPRARDPPRDAGLGVTLGVSPLGPAPRGSDAGPMLTDSTSESGPTDIVLAARAAEGDDAAFATLYQRHHPRVYGLCLRILRCPEDAADATQQTFLNMHRFLAKGSSPAGNVGAYLMRIAERTSFEIHRRRNRQRALQESDGVRHYDLVIEPDHATAIVTAHSVRHAASALPERYRAVLLMREVDDLAYEEIAERLGMNQNAVAQLLHRARKRLALELTGDSAPAAAPLAA